MSRFRLVAHALSLAALGVAVLGTAVQPAGAAGQVSEIAPYFETTGGHSANLSTAVSGHGLKSFTAAFVLGKGCTPTWDDYSPIAAATARNALVTTAKSAGATPIISFGGQAGTELATSCTNATKLVNAYTSVINKFGVNKIDFDIEGKARLNATAVNKRRYTAIRALEKKFPQLEVSVTIPVGEGGILATNTYGNGMAFLQLAKSTNTRIDVVNIMAMNYGGAINDMGAAAVKAATASMGQLKTIWPTATYAKLGITPMIGQNDVGGENFTWNDSQTVVAFARAHGVRRLAFWDLNRDQACAGGDSAPGACTGNNQDALDYTDGFLATGA